MDPVRLPAGRVVLRAHRDEDINGVLDQSNDPVSQTFTTVPVPYHRAHAAQFVREISPDGWRHGTYLALAIADAETDEYYGTVDFTPDGSRGAEVGFGLRAAARGRGVMTAALRAAVDWAFATDGLALDVLHWRAHVGNWPSRRVAWRCGFRVEGTVRGLCAARGQRYDGWIGSLRSGDPRRPNTPWYDVPTLRGQRCVLRRFRESDTAAVVAACSDPVTQHWLAGLPRPYTHSAGLGYIQSREEEHASGRGVYWAAADPVTDECIGSFGLMDIDVITATAEIGYWTHPAARGRGVASEATRLVARHAVITIDDGGLGLHHLTLRAAAGNVASQRVAERAGFRRVGVWRSAERLGDDTYDDLVGFDLLASDVAASHQDQR